MGNKSYQTENYFHYTYIDRYNNPEAYKNLYPDNFMLNYKKDSIGDTWKLTTNTRNRSINTHHTLSSSKLFELLCMSTFTVIFYEMILLKCKKIQSSMLNSFLP